MRKKLKNRYFLRINLICLKLNYLNVQSSMYDKSVMNRENLPSNSIEAAYFNERFTILTSFTKQRNIDRYVHMYVYSVPH